MDSAISQAFGNDVDFAQIIKTYGHQEVSNNRRYSAPDFVSSEKVVVIGNPEQRSLISTSYVERLNATTRLSHAPPDSLDVGLQQEVGQL